MGITRCNSSTTVACMKCAAARNCNGVSTYKSCSRPSENGQIPTICSLAYTGIKILRSLSSMHDDIIVSNTFYFLSMCRRGTQNRTATNFGRFELTISRYDHVWTCACLPKDVCIVRKLHKARITLQCLHRVVPPLTVKQR